MLFCVCLFWMCVQVDVLPQTTMFDHVSTGKPTGPIRTYFSDLITSSVPSSVLSVERQQVLGALERLQAKLVQREEWTYGDTVGSLRDTLQSPLFTHILTLQQSIRQLRNQVRPVNLSVYLWTGKFGDVQRVQGSQHMLALMLTAEGRNSV